MPVPEQRIPEVAQEGISGQITSGATANSFGAQSARGLQALGGGFQQLGEAVQFVQDMKDEAAVDERLTQYSDALRALTYDTGTGYLGTQGGAALGGYDAFAEAVEKTREEFAEGLSPRAAQLYDAKAESQRAQALDAGIRHQAQQTLNWVNSTNDAHIVALSEDVLAVGNDPEKSATLLAEIASRIQQKGARNGWSQVQIDNEIREVQSGIHKDKATMLAVDNPFAAAAYLAANGEDMLAADKHDTGVLLEPFVKDAAALEAADKIQEDHGGDLIGVDIYEALREADVPADLWDETLGHLQNDQNSQVTAKNQQRILKSDWIVNNPGISITDINQETREWLGVDGMQMLQNHRNLKRAERVEEFIVANADRSVSSFTSAELEFLGEAGLHSFKAYAAALQGVSSQERLYQELRDLANADPQKFLGTDILDYGNQLTEDSRDFLVELQREMSISPEGQPPLEGTSLIDLNRYMATAEGMMAAEGVFNTDDHGVVKDAKYFEAVNAVEADLVGLVDVFRREKGRAPEAGEVREIIEPLLVRYATGKYKGSWRSGGRVPEVIFGFQANDRPLDVRGRLLASPSAVPARREAQGRTVVAEVLGIDEADVTDEHIAGWYKNVVLPELEHELYGVPQHLRPQGRTAVAKEQGIEEAAVTPEQIDQWYLTVYLNPQAETGQ